jgi:hypothetical protein
MPHMYRPALATWFQSLVQRLPLKALPHAKQIEIAKTFTQQPDLPWCRFTFATVHALVWAQAMEAQVAVDGRLAHELLAAMSWDREIIVPESGQLRRVVADPVLPANALATLAELPKQTTYLLFEQPSLVDPSVFVTGAWLIHDLDVDTGDKILLLLLDLLIEGKPVRDMLLEFSIEQSFDEAVEKQVEKIARTQAWDMVPGAVERRDNLRAYMNTTRPVLAAFIDTLVNQRETLERARRNVAADELGFTLVDLARADTGMRQPASLQ